MEQEFALQLKLGINRPIFLACAMTIIATSKTIGGYGLAPSPAVKFEERLGYEKRNLAKPR
jgi:hypothetical protein